MLPGPWHTGIGYGAVPWLFTLKTNEVPMGVDFKTTACSTEQLGLCFTFAQWSEVGISCNGLAKTLVERDGAIDPGARGCEVAPQAGVAAEIKLDRGFFGVVCFGFE